MNVEKMIDRAVAKGQNRETAVALLNDLIAMHSGKNLPYFLQYWNFISMSTYNKMAAN